jgi:hypothetical protein
LNLQLTKPNQMKKIIPTIFISLFVLSSYAQIPNQGFESWTDMGNYDVPDAWANLNSLTSAMSVYTCEMGTPGSPGSSYMKLTSKTVTGLGVVPGIAVCGELDVVSQAPMSGIPFSERPGSFKGKWQHMIWGSSQGSIEVTLTKWNNMSMQRDVIGVAQQTLSGMAMSWANFTIDFAYQSNAFPDSCMIVMNASGSNPTNNDYLWVDNLSFAGGTVALADIQATQSAINVFPNPASEFVQVEYAGMRVMELEIQLVQLDGKIISDLNLMMLPENGIWRIETADLASGFYYLNIISDYGITSRKLMIE